MGPHKPRCAYLPRWIAGPFSRVPQLSRSLHALSHGSTPGVRSRSSRPTSSHGSSPSTSIAGRVHRYVPTLSRPRSIEAVGSRAVVAHSEIGAITIVRELVAFGRSCPSRIRRAAVHGRASRRASRLRDGRQARAGRGARRHRRARAEPRRRRAARPAHHDRPDRPHALGRARLEGARRSRSSMCGIARGRGSCAASGRRSSPTTSAFAPGGRHAWVSSGAVDEVAIYSARSGRLLQDPPADEPPQHFTFRGERVVPRERRERDAPGSCRGRAVCFA